MLSLMLKLAGGIFISCGGILTSIYMNWKLKKALDEADRFIAFVKYVREQVDSYAMPVTEILERCRIEGQLKGILERCEGVKNFKELADNIYTSDVEIRKSITKFLNGFGRNSREEATRECDECLHILSIRRSFLADNLPRQKK